jgi:hypothetical protein
MAFALGAVLLFVAFAYHRGPDSYLRINDHLDGFVPLNVVLADEPLFASLDSVVEPVMGGLSRNALPTVWTLGALPFRLLDPMAALFVNELIIRLVALAGMLLLLRRHVLREGNDLVVYGASVCFALLPFLPAAYLSVAGQPWLLHALLNLRRGRAGVTDWLVVIVFPLASSLAFVGFYVLLALGLLVAIDTLRQRRIPRSLTLALVLTGGLYAASEYRLLYQTFLAEGYVSFRSEYAFRGTSLVWAGWVALRNLLFSQHHAAAQQFPFLLATLGLAVGIELLQAKRQGRLRELLPATGTPDSPSSNPGAPFLLLASLVSIGAIAAAVGLYEWSVVQELLRSSGLGVLRMFNFHRFQWFHPLLFGVAFALALHLLHRRGGLAGKAALLLLGLQLAWSVSQSDPLRVQRETGLTFQDYYSAELFSEIREFIGRPDGSYRVASFGLAPGIALTNGFSTVDAYLSNYPLEYKHRFRGVIAPELERDARLRAEYDERGWHVHLYSSELGLVVGYRKGGPYTKDHPVRAVEEVRFDAGQLKELGCDYVISAVDIRNHESLGLTLERTFERKDSPWQMFLYSL